MKSIEKEKWDEKEIKKAAKIILDAEKNKGIFIKILDEIVHWILLLIILFGNIILNVFIILISGLLSAPLFYTIVVLIAILFGILIEIPLRDIEKIDKNKHFISRIVLPLLALVNIYILIGIKNTIENISETVFEFNIVMIGLLYGICFLLPHLVSFIFRKRN